MRFIA
ncbi:hypothetical protein YPPY103_1982, partial [Yersinia pestis PY-103]